MALPSTLYRFHIELSDVERGNYQSIELRVAMHPSESIPFLLTRVIAYCLNITEGIEMTLGIGNPDEPAVQVKDLTGRRLACIEIGSPSARRLHKAAKGAARVCVYTYRDPAILIREAATEEIYRRDEIEVYAMPVKFLDRLGATLERDNRWQLLHDEGELTVTTRGGEAVSGEMTRHSLGQR